eukprot:525668-Rhodomonas_salina.3
MERWPEEHHDKQDTMRTHCIQASAPDTPSTQSAGMGGALGAASHPPRSNTLRDSTRTRCHPPVSPAVSPLPRPSQKELENHLDRSNEVSPVRATVPLFWPFCPVRVSPQTTKFHKQLERNDKKRVSNFDFSCQLFCARLVDMQWNAPSHLGHVLKISKYLEKHVKFENRKEVSIRRGGLLTSREHAVSFYPPPGPRASGGRGLRALAPILELAP